MTSDIDGGPILEQRTFDLAADETSFSLNAKCFEAAIDSFAELVSGLASGTIRPRPQGPRTGRAFERHRRPAAACTIDWTRPAREIDALVRALDYGRYRNPVGAAKIQHGGRALIVLRAQASSDGSRAASPPGTVLACNAQEVRVATGDGAISLCGFSDLRGRELDPAQAARELDLAPGAALDHLDFERSRRLSELDRRMSRAEAHWVERLASLDPITLPVPAASGAPPSAIEIAVPPELAQPEVLTAAFCAYLARLGRRIAFDLGYADAELRRDVGGEPSIAPCLPLRVEVDLERDFSALLRHVAAEIAAARERGPWLLDAIARHPELQGLREDSRRLFPVAVDTREAAWNLELAPGGPRFVFDAGTVSPAHAASLASGFSAFLASLAAEPGRKLAAHPAVSAEDLERQRIEWNRTAAAHEREVCVHELFAEQVARTPDAIALRCAGTSVTYAELDSRADRLAAVLSELGVRAGTLVGIFLERGIDLVVAVLGTLKAGGAYVPLDPGHPSERTDFLLEDAGIEVIVTREVLAGSLPAPLAPSGAAKPSDPAYVIYTSGSTGRPKGVIVEHRNLASFFAAMDACVPHDPPGVWLAMTSLSFDISVLELLWPLCRGFEVVVDRGGDRTRGRAPRSRRPVEFSLSYFSSDEGERSDGYRLLLEGARFADEHGFAAVWTPERHFHAFGGLFPNPAVTGAAIAAVTRRVQIRAGSVVLPLHHPVRVAEDWALVDNLSGGRAAISFASGWNPEDFVLAREPRSRAKEVMFRDIEVVRRLWRGESLPFSGPEGPPVSVRTLPRPVQPELPVWITSAGNVDTYEAAGRMGANVLTHLLGQSIEQLATKIRAYREARKQAGFDPAGGTVTLMLHTCVGEDEDQVRERVREPLERYLASSLSLLKGNAWAFPAFRRPNGAEPDEKDDLSALEPEERAAMLAHARERYYETSGLFGTPERCLEQVARLRAIDVDEIACLIDFGLPADEVLASLPLLDRVRREAQRLEPARDGPSLDEVILEQRVTHLQCTPSMARILVSDPGTRAALRGVRHVFVGGEALPADLAAELAGAVGGSTTNMYGPTETTIWSSTHAVEPGSIGSGTVPIGRPIANTRFHVLDESLQPLPIGVAGELCIAGDGVARGYLRRPDLDAERFVPEPQTGSRMYRTGDLVRYRDDGVLEFLGRIDHQIKIRGHRVEPGEIEAALLEECQEAVVLAREDTPGDQRLVAYLVPRGAAPDARRLREQLEARLPEAMVPSQFVVLERLPRNPNGKIDRRALPVPEARPEAECILPAGELESRLAELWREVLALPRVGVEDNFFDLGGHSLLIVRLHRRMHELTSKPVPLTDLFRFPTIRSLARHLAAESSPEIVEEASLRGRRRRRATPLQRRRAVGS